MDIENWYNRIPIITRVYVSIIGIVMLGCQLKLWNKYQLFFSWPLFREGQYWRLFTTYFFFGSPSIDTLFHLYFTLQYFQSLEDESYRGRRADFVYLLLYSTVATTLLSVVFRLSTYIPFLSNCLTFIVTYIWARRNPSVRMNFLGLLTFHAPYLPLTLIGFTVVLHSSIPYSDLLGLVVGHLYYYAEDVYPLLPHSNGYRFFACPQWFKNLIEPRDDYEPIQDAPVLNDNLNENPN
ncbi:Derlin [Globomyces pollinis-pini]|nr:Derlin [Globomyces pollinis-pini]